MGHSRPMHSVPVPIDVRCYSNSDIIVRRSEMTLGATSGSKRVPHVSDCSTELSYSLGPARSQRGTLSAIKLNPVASPNQGDFDRHEAIE